MRSSSRGGRACFLALLALAIDEPKRSAPAGPRPISGARWRELFGVPLYRDAVFGYIAQTFAIGGFAAWAPTYLNRELHMDLKSADFWFGLILVVSGLFATFIGGYLGDRWPGQDRARANLRVCALPPWRASPSLFIASWRASPVGFFVGIGVAEFAHLPFDLAHQRGHPARGPRGASRQRHGDVDLCHSPVRRHDSPPLVGAMSDAWTLRSRDVRAPGGAGDCRVRVAAGQSRMGCLAAAEARERAVSRPR